MSVEEIVRIMKGKTDVNTPSKSFTKAVTEILDKEKRDSVSDKD